MNLLSLATLLLAQADADWDARALQLEYEGSYDQAVIARIEAIRAAGPEEEEQHRRELTRQLQWYQGLVATVRGEVTDSHAAGGRIAVIDHDLRVHDASTGRRLYDPVPVEGSPWVTLAEEAPRAVIVGSDPRVLQVIDLESGKSIFERPFGYDGHAISPDGQMLALAWVEEESYGVDFVDLDSGEMSRTTVEGPIDEGLHALEYSPDGRSLLCTFGDFVLFDVAEGACTRVHPPATHGDNPTPYRREWINGARQIAETFGSIGIWDCATAKWKVQRLFPGDTTEDLAFNVEEGILTSVGFQDVYRFSTDTGEAVGRPIVLDDMTRDGFLAIEYHRGVCSNDGHLVAALGEFGRIRVWDAKSGKKLAREFSHGRLRAKYAESEIELEFIDPRRIAAEVPDQFVRVWEVGDVVADATDITEYGIDLADHRSPSPRCAVARRLARASVYSALGPARALPLPDGQYSGLCVTKAGDRAYFSGKHHGVWEVSLTDLQREPRLVAEPSRYWGIETSPDGSHLLLKDGSCSDVIDAAAGVPTERFSSVTGSPHVLDDDGRLHVHVEGSWKVADGPVSWGIWDDKFRDEIHEKRGEPLMLKPFHHPGTVTVDGWEEGGTFEATWTPENGTPVKTVSDTELWEDLDLEQLLTSPAPPALVLYDYETLTFKVHHLTTGKKTNIRWKAIHPMQVILGDDRLLVASEEEAVLFRISDRSVLAMTPQLGGIEEVALIPGQDAFVVMQEQACIEGFDALTGERVSPRWWSDAYRLWLHSDDGESAIAAYGEDTYEYSYATGTARAIPSSRRTDQAEEAPTEGPLLLAEFDRTLAEVKDGEMIPGPTRRWTFRSSGAWLRGTSAQRFLNEEKTIALVGVSVSSQGLEFQYADFRPTRLEPAQGDINALSEEWCRKLALEVVDGKIQPAR